MKITFDSVLEKSRKKNFKASNNLHWFSSKLSIYFSYIFIKLRLSADQVTIIFFITGLIGSFLYMSTSPIITFLGYLFFRLHIIFDLSDGEVARFNNSSSIRGSYWDSMIHSLLNPLYALFICISYYKIFHNNIFLIIAPFITLIFSLTLAVKHNYYKALFNNKGTQNPKNIKLYKSFFSRLIYVFSEIISLEGLVLTSIFIKIFGIEDYALYSLVLFSVFNLLLVFVKFYLFSYTNSIYTKS